MVQKEYQSLVDLIQSLSESIHDMSQNQTDLSVSVARLEEKTTSLTTLITRTECSEKEIAVIKNSLFWAKWLVSGVSCVFTGILVGVATPILLRIFKV